MELPTIIESGRLRELGIDPSRTKALTRLRPGYYVATEEYEALGTGPRYCLRAVAAHRARDAPIFALETALALHGLPFGQEPKYVFTTGLRYASGSQGDMRCSHLPIRDEFVTTVDGIRCSDVAWTLADLARRRLPTASVPSIDVALREGMVTKQEIEHALSHQSRRGRIRARWAVAEADAASESVGESRSRVTIVLLGFPRPQLQVVTQTSLGEKRSDFGWLLGNRWLLGEFDGMVKYGELAARAGKDGAEALAEEKQREDAIRREDRGMVRWVWGDLVVPSRLERILLGAGLPKTTPILPAGVRLLR